MDTESGDLASSISGITISELFWMCVPPSIATYFYSCCCPVDSFHTPWSNPWEERTFDRSRLLLLSLFGLSYVWQRKRFLPHLWISSPGIWCLFWSNRLLSLRRAPGSRMQLAMLHFHFMSVGTFHVIDMSGTKIPFYKVSLYYFFLFFFFFLGDEAKRRESFLVLFLII